jgi:hypothetical protein
MLLSLSLSWPDLIWKVVVIWFSLFLPARENKKHFFIYFCGWSLLPGAASALSAASGLLGLGLGTPAAVLLGVGCTCRTVGDGWTTTAAAAARHWR